MNVERDYALLLLPSPYLVDNQFVESPLIMMPFTCNLSAAHHNYRYIYLKLQQRTELFLDWQIRQCGLDFGGIELPNYQLHE